MVNSGPNFSDSAFLPYRVGALMYTPAINTGIAEKLQQGVWPCLTSIAFCLEDSIQDDALEEAEQQLRQTLCTLRGMNIPAAQLPLLFVRIRTPEHMERVHALLGDEERLLTGYVLPKFDLGNAERYAALVRRFNEGRSEPLYIMPTLESGMIAGISSRTTALASLKAMLDSIREYVLNVRVGGNDFSRLYGVRRSVRQNIYEIGVIRDILVDIINVFARDYVVSGPVWEYFGENPEGEWAQGLRRELELDRLNGFIGKTAIHPSQLPVIFACMKVPRADYEDAKAILGWTDDSYGVAKSADGSRMNEVKCHGRWARRVYCLGKVYGVLDD